MPRAENELRYAKIASLWPRGDIVNISYSPALDLDIKIPLAFIATSGQNTIGFVEELAQTLVLESGELRRSDAPEIELDLAAPLSQPDNFVFLPDERSMAFTERRGPESKARLRAPAANEDGASSVSHSSRDSANQNSFREQLLARDGMCYFTGTSGPSCVPAHIAPCSRIDVYEELLDDAFQFDAEHGILLNRTLHREYDKLEWSLYYKDDQYFFHCFNAKKDFLVKHHGSSAKVADMRCLAPPSPALCKWHYTQCVLKTVRGYSYGMAQNAF
ncbi:RHTO0S45e00100g1_1 [Rhodotorula toruloides]|uniref:RHTO0S45e00100g1_1 n=1 Tax=Rhodotorula toruloides TaxID=5286 RepID=A0A061BK90_RHOTO|nr:RHTO0S45e00100g1_1 [Rhodotorula toruloides]